jgi:hypothetical protein
METRATTESFLKMTQLVPICLIPMKALGVCSHHNDPEPTPSETNQAKEVA